MISKDQGLGIEGRKHQEERMEGIGMDQEKGNQRCGTLIGLEGQHGWIVVMIPGGGCERLLWCGKQDRCCWKHNERKGHQGERE